MSLCVVLNIFYLIIITITLYNIKFSVDTNKMKCFHVKIAFYYITDNMIIINYADRCN